MKKWKLGALALIFFLLLVALCAVTLIDDTEDQQTINDSALSASSEDLIYTEVYTTTGSGSSAVTTLTSYTVSASNVNISGSLVIPETYNDLPISGILANGFKDCTKLTEVTIPSKCINLGANAFADCTSLSKIYYNVQNNTSTASYTSETTPWLDTGSDEGVTLIIGNAVTKIATYNFAYFTNLKIITGAPSVTSIGSYAFYGCANLVSYPYMDGLTSIGTSAFANCAALEQINVPGSVTSLSSNAFAGCVSVQSIIYDCKIASCTLWNSTNTPWLDVGRDAADGITLIIGSSVTSLPYYAFYGLTHVSTVIAHSASYTLISPSSSSSTKIYPFETVGSDEEYVTLIIPDEVTAIGNSAFYNFTELNKIEIGKGLTSTGTLAFSGCSNLEIIEYNAIGDATKYTSYSDTTSPYVNAGAAGWTLKIGSDVKVIHQYQFRYAKNLVSIDTSEASSLKQIRYYAFDSFTSLRSITIPESVEIIENYAFSNNTSVESIYYNAVSVIDPYGSSYPWFGNTGSSSGLAIYIGDAVQSLPVLLFRSVLNLTTVYYNTNTDIIKVYNTNNPFANVGILNEDGFDLVIGDNVTQIPRYAFYGVTNLKSVTLGPNVTKIGSNAFVGCTKLTDVSVAKNTVIDASAFDDNIKLSYVDTVTVHFNSNGGSSIADKILLSGNKLTKPDDPVRDGYNFAGWHTNVALTKEYNFDSPVDADITLYADWSNINDDPVDEVIDDKNETNYTWILWIVVILIALYLIFGGRKR